MMHGRVQHELPAFQDHLDRQAARTRTLRMPLLERAGIQRARDVLDVGCGSGAVTADLAALCPDGVVALDVESIMVQRSRARLVDAATVLQADGARLPFADAAFDVVHCNLLLLWARDPESLVQEMARVVRPGGTVVAGMEPDYGGKIHWPENPLVDLVFRGDGIRRRGGDPHAGRKLRDWFVRAGLRTDVGILNPDLPGTEEDLRSLRRNRRYYRRLLFENGFSKAAVDAWEEETLQALDEGIQSSFLPCFWAIGRRPGPEGPERP